ncbi:hypothetical protein Avbf_17996 [Armadillidium vulgare]|nr:hypothetical protein Avbf_17996 [Armadillidium vulgare]
MEKNLKVNYYVLKENYEVLYFVICEEMKSVGMRMKIWRSLRMRNRFHRTTVQESNIWICIRIIMSNGDRITVIKMTWRCGLGNYESRKITNLSSEIIIIIDSSLGCMLIISIVMHGLSLRLVIIIIITISRHTSITSLIALFCKKIKEIFVQLRSLKFKMSSSTGITKVTRKPILPNYAN